MSSAFVTDFNPNRAMPVARDIGVSNSRKQIENLLNEMRLENIVEGWVAVR